MNDVSDANNVSDANDVSNANLRTDSHYQSANRSAVTKLFLLEGFLYAAALALFDATSVVAMFLSTLGASTWQIGLVSAIKLVGFHAPQVFVATRFDRRLSGLLVKFVSFQWLATVLMAFSPVVARFLGAGPALVCFAFGWSCFSFGEGAYFVPWSEAVASTVGRRCGKFLGVYGLVESLGTLFAGAIVYMAAKTGVMSNSYGYLGIFGLGSIGLMVTVPVLVRVEHYGDLARLGRRRRFDMLAQVPAGTKARVSSQVPADVQTWVSPQMPAGAQARLSEQVPGDVQAHVSLPEQLPGDDASSRRANAFATFRRVLAVSGRGFRAFVGAQLLSMVAYSISPFILLYGCNELGLTTGASSLIVWAEMAGIAAGSILAGRLASRFGSRAVVRLSCVASASVPLLALLSGTMQNGAPTEFSVISVMVSMLCLGIFHGSSWVSCTGYVVERINEEDRAMINAVLNSMMLPFLCLSPVGGLAVKQVGYMPVFAAALVPCLVSAVLAFKVD